VTYPTHPTTDKESTMSDNAPNVRPVKLVVQWPEGGNRRVTVRAAWPDALPGLLDVAAVAAVADGKDGVPVEIRYGAEGRLDVTMSKTDLAVFLAEAEVADQDVWAE